jgi:hypothetical protein
LQQVLNPVYAARVAAFFFALLDPAYFQHRCAARFLRRHASGYVFLGFTFDVIPEFLVQLLVRFSTPEE